MFWKKHKKIMMLTLALALVVSSVVSLGGQAEAANAMDLFKRVYKQASGENFPGFNNITNKVEPQQPVKPKPVEPVNPEPVEPAQPTDPEEPQQPEAPQTEQPDNPDQVEPEQPVNPEPVEPESQPEPERPSNANVADKIIKTGEKYLGTPYKYGAPYGQTNTFDCSSFTKTVFAENGITLPRSSRQQAQVGTPVSKNELQKGDLIFTSTSYSSNISHVAIYVGNDKVLHTYGPGGVRYDKFSGSWLERAYITARRVIE